MSLTPELEEAHKMIKGYVKSYGLDTFETIFEMIDANQINQIAAYGGFPTRYPHWKWGMSYEQISKGYEWGLSKIYEMVINTDPCYAYLMRANNMTDQKTVMAHVYGHCDFFKHNYFFSVTNRKMVDKMANHATKIRRMHDKYGEDSVEDVIDICLSVENLIDVHGPYRKSSELALQQEDKEKAGRLKSKSYMDKFINPPEFLDEQVKNHEEKLANEKIPLNPERDVLDFILRYSNLEGWKKEVLSIIREEAYYFAPQGMTKIMNEGWATYWHSKIMTEKVLNDSEIVDFADAHSGILAMAPGQINPYKIGVELYKHIEERWDKGRFGAEYHQCLDYKKKMNWDTHTMKGRERIFEVRSFYNDITFIDEFLDEDFANRIKLFNYGRDKRTGKVVIIDRDYTKIKKQLLEQLTNMGNPTIEVVDGNYRNRSELLLSHSYETREIDMAYAHRVLSNLEKLWTRPVTLETMLSGKKVFIHCEEGKISQSSV